jgi:hypothetical protein
LTKPPIAPGQPAGAPPDLCCGIVSAGAVLDGGAVLVCVGAGVVGVVVVAGGVVAVLVVGVLGVVVVAVGVVAVVAGGVVGVVPVNAGWSVVTAAWSPELEPPQAASPSVSRRSAGTRRILVLSISAP